MSVDYKAIADDLQNNHTAIFDLAITQLNIEYPTKDENGDPIMLGGKFMDLSFVENAYDAIKDDVIDEQIDGWKVTYELINSKINTQAANKLYDIINEAITDGSLKAWINTALVTGGVSGKKLKAFITSNVGSFGITQGFIDALKYSIQKHRGIKAGHVQNAIQKRHAGLI